MKKGRPTSLTPALQSKVISAIKAGAYVETAAAFAGISKDTFYAWLRKGAKESPGQPYREFSDAVEEAQVFSELNDLRVIDQAAAKGQWQAAAWRLERKFPQRWGRRQEVDLGESTKESFTLWLKALREKG